MLALGALHIFCTDIAKDGVMQGPSVELYKNIMKQFPSLQFIASGGVSTIDDVIELQNIGCSGVIIGKAIYEGKITLQDLRNLNSN